MGVLGQTRRLAKQPSNAEANGGLKRFAGDERGAIAVLFALLLLPILGIVFAGIDYSRALSVQSQLQTAAEAATGTALSRLPEGREAAEAAFDAAFRANLPGELKDQTYALDVTANSTAIEVEIKASVPTTLVSLLGLDKLDVAAQTKASLPDPMAVAHRRNLKHGLDAIPGASGSRARAQIEDALRNPGAAAAGMPSPQEMAEAEAQMREAMRGLGISVPHAARHELPDPEEIKRLQEKVARELSRLRF